MSIDNFQARYIGRYKLSDKQLACKSKAAYGFFKHCLETSKKAYNTFVKFRNEYFSIRSKLKIRVQKRCIYYNDIYSYYVFNEKPEMVVIIHKDKLNYFIFLLIFETSQSAEEFENKFKLNFPDNNSIGDNQYQSTNSNHQNNSTFYLSNETNQFSNDLSGDEYMQFDGQIHSDSDDINKTSIIDSRTSNLIASDYSLNGNNLGEESWRPSIDESVVGTEQNMEPLDMNNLPEYINFNHKIDYNNNNNNNNNNIVDNYNYGIRDEDDESYASEENIEYIETSKTHTSPFNFDDIGSNESDQCIAYPQLKDSENKDYHSDDNYESPDELEKGNENINTTLYKCDSNYGINIDPFNDHKFQNINDQSYTDGIRDVDDESHVSEENIEYIETSKTHTSPFNFDDNGSNESGQFKEGDFVADYLDDDQISFNNSANNNFKSNSIKNPIYRTRSIDEIDMPLNLIKLDNHAFSKLSELTDKENYRYNIDVFDGSKYIYSYASIDNNLHIYSDCQSFDE